MTLGCGAMSHLIAAQDTFVPKVIFEDNSEEQELDFRDVLRSQDSMQMDRRMQTAISQLWQDGYLTAHRDSTYRLQDTVCVVVYVGDRYVYNDVEVTSEQLGIVSAAGLKNVRWRDKVIETEMLRGYTERMLVYLENNGYPFAKVGLHKSTLEDGRLRASLLLDKKKFVPFDSLQINGGQIVRPQFLERYLDISAGDPYSRQKINNIRRRIVDLPFIELDSSTVIKFANEVAEVQLYLKPKKASRFDFLIGVLPSSEGGQTRFNITGEFTAEMHNRLGHGEYIYANFQRIAPTQQLELRLKYPYLFDLPIGADIKGGIYFNEVFRETIFDGGLLYQFDGSMQLKASWNSKASRLIEIDTAAVIASMRLPDQLDITYNGGGIEFSARSLDYRFNPSRGWDIRVGGTVGIKNVISNNTIEALSREGVDYVAAYDTLMGSTLQTEATLSAAYYIPAIKVATLRLGIEAGLKYNEERIYDNERYRIGGNRLLRGFDELSVLTDTYLVSTAEFRLLLDRNSYLSFPFVDYGLTRVRIEDEEIWDTALSFGMGINFSTPAGIFNVSFAAGRRLGNPFDLGNTKIHFGYVSLF